MFKKYDMVVEDGEVRAVESADGAYMLAADADVAIRGAKGNSEMTVVSVWGVYDKALLLLDDILCDPAGWPYEYPTPQEILADRWGGYCEKLDEIRACAAELCPLENAPTEDHKRAREQFLRIKEAIERGEF